MCSVIYVLALAILNYIYIFLVPLYPNVDGLHAFHFEKKKKSANNN